MATEPHFQFEWDESKATVNIRKHDISFETAATIFDDPRLLTIADLAHSGGEERWFSIGFATNGALLSVVYLWFAANASVTKVRLVSARKATQAEIRYYQESIWAT